jgi:hypothetical protein
MLELNPSHFDFGLDLMTCLHVIGIGRKKTLVLQWRHLADPALVNLASLVMKHMDVMHP